MLGRLFKKSKNLIRIELGFAILFSEYFSFWVYSATQVEFSYISIHYFSAVIAFFLLASYLSDWVRKRLRMLSNLVYVFGILFVIYVAYINQFSRDSVLILFLVFSFFSFMLSSIRVFWVFNALVIASIIAALFALNFETWVSPWFVLIPTLLISLGGFSITNARTYYQKKIKKREDFLNHIFNQSFMGLLLVHKESGEVWDANDKAVKILQYEFRDDLINWPIEEVEVDGDLVFQGQLNKKFTTHELRDKRILRVNIQDIKYGKNDLLLISLDEFKNALEIKNSSEYEKVSEYSEQSYQHLFEKNASMMCIIDHNNVMVDVNESLAKLLGYSKDELKGKKYEEITLEEAKNRSELNRQAWSGKVVSFEKKIVDKKGKEYDLEVVLKKGKYFGQDVLISNARDISERKKLETEADLAYERYYNVTNQSAIGFVVSDLEGKLVETNRAFLDFIGFSEEELNDIDIADLNHPEDTHLSKEVGDKLINGEIQVGEFEKRYYHKDGSLLYALIKVILQKDEFGSPQYFFSQVVDITGIRNAQNELILSEKSYKDLFNNTDDLLYILNRDNQFIDVNEAVIEHYGYKKHEIIGKTPEIFSAPGQNELEGIYLDMEKVWEGEHLETLWWSVKKSGEVFPKNLSIRKGIYLGNEVLIAKGKDISESYLFERQLKEKEKRYRDLFERNLAGVYRTSLSGEILECNPAFLNILGYKDVDWKKLKLNANDFHINQKERDKFLKKLEKKNYLRGERLNLKKRSGDIITVLINVSVIRAEDDSFKYFEGSLIDITDLEKTRQKLAESEHKYKDLVESASFGVLLLRENRFVFANPKSMEVLGYKDSNNVLEKEIDLILLEEDRPLFEKEMEILQKKKSIPFSNYTFKNRQGKLVDVEAKFSLIEYEGTEIIQLTFIDISDKIKIKAATEKIKSTEKFNSILQKQLHEKEVLLKEVHHRVKNNMQVISSILSLQSSYHQDKKVNKILKESQNRILTMALIHEKLYTTKDFSEISFDSYIEDLVRNIVGSNKAKGVEIDLQFKLDKMFLNLDHAIPLGLIVNELVSNSLKYAFVDRKRGTLILKLIEEGSKIILSIEDNGVGIDKKIDFRKTETLGLQLVNTLVEQLNGEIERIETEGAGFSIKFNRFE